MDYLDFRVQYETQHPASIPKRDDFAVVRPYPKRLAYVVLLIFVCASLVSGVHTIPTVREGMGKTGMFSADVLDAVSYSAFMAFELNTFVSAYSLMHKRSRWILFALGVSVAVMIASNLLQVLRAFSSDGGTETQLIALIVGVGAPLVAIAMGEFFVDIDRTNRQGDAESAARLLGARQQFDAEVLAAFQAAEKQQARRTSARPPLSAAPLPDGQADADKGHGSGQGYTKRTDAREIAYRYLNDHPEAADTYNVRDLGERMGVGKTTAAEVLAQWREERTVPNGHPQESA